MNTRLADLQRRAERMGFYFHQKKVPGSRRRRTGGFRVVDIGAKRIAASPDFSFVLDDVEAFLEAERDRLGEARPVWEDELCRALKPCPVLAIGRATNR